MASILIVDNNDLVLAALRDPLESSGYTVVVASSRSSTKRALREKHYDLVLVDLLMEEMYGMQLIRELRGASPGQRIVAMSGGEQLERPKLLENVEKLYGVTTIEKPVRNVELLRTIAAVLKT